MERGHRQTTDDDTQNSRNKDKQTFVRSESSLYMFHFGLGPFYLNRKKKIYIGLL